MKERTYNKCVYNLTGIRVNKRSRKSISCLSEIRDSLELNKDYFLNLAYDDLYDKLKNKEEFNKYLESHRRIKEMKK